MLFLLFLCCSHQVLYPYMLELVTPAEYTLAMAAVCKSLATIAAKKRAALKPEEFEIDFDVEVNLPKPPVLLSRLMVMAGHPHERGRGQYVLTLLKAIGPILHEEISGLFDTVIPRLLQYLQGG